ncbi:hypothetical protein CHUAL_005648 [Chamberlinius hualienensis]
MRLWIVRLLLAVHVWLLAAKLVHAAASSWMYLGLSGISVSPANDNQQQLMTVANPTIGTSPRDRLRSLCNTLPGLVSQQIEVCETQPNSIQSVSEGARRGIQECQFQFRNERWNCTTGDTEIFTSTLQRGSRETAFVYAVTSAGVVHAVTQACSSGNFTECSCDISKQGQTTPEGWKWGGCSDNLAHGLAFSRNFVDAPERLKHQKSQNVRNKMNLHNNEAGRKSIEKLMRTQCRCHGVSGSCELKTCWRTLPPFTDVGDQLKKKYEIAVRVKGTARKRLRRQDKTGKKVTVPKEELVHIHRSPNYCVENKTRGILGTRGRACNKTAAGPESCDLLCCGRGYNTQKEAPFFTDCNIHKLNSSAKNFEVRPVLAVVSPLNLRDSKDLALNIIAIDRKLN